MTPVSPEAQASMDALKALREERMSEHAATPASEPEAKEKKLTTYEVFEASPEGSAHQLQFIRRVEAVNDIKAVASAIGDRREGSFVAIPSRSLRVRTVSLESIPKVSIS